MATEANLTEEEQWEHFLEMFYLAATFQGRAAYFLMSIHAVNPGVLTQILGIDPFPYLWATMIYGVAIMIFSRPSMRVIFPLNRIAFGMLGSLMFNHASMVCFKYLCTVFPDRPFMRTFMGFLSGRLMMVHLLAFLYHIDTRTNIPDLYVTRDVAFEGMYSVY
nr:uncharacterized protein LOC111504122 isoform X1 [Leptinotarsa decemlineata]